MMRLIQRKYTKLACLLVILSLVLVGCGGKTTPQGQAYKTLLTAKTTYEATMSSLADLYKQGKITDADRDKAITYGRTFYQSFQVAVSALDAGSALEIGKALQALSELVKFVGQFTGGK
jgi:hypothetical protein